MKKSINYILIFLVMALVAFPAYSQEITGAYAKTALGGDYLDGYDFKSSNGTSYIAADTDFDFGTIGLIAGGYRFQESFALEMEYAQRKHGLNTVHVVGSEVLDQGDMKAKSLMFNAIYYITSFDTVNPYFGLGLGLLTDLEQELEIAGYGSKHSSDGEAFAIQALLGLEVPVTPEFRFFFEGRIFTASSPDISNSTSTYNVAYDTVSLMGGLVYIFSMD